jgi:hypothetical protein
VAVVRHRLRRTAAALGVTGVDVLDDLLDAAFPWAPGDPRYATNPLAPGALPLELSWSAAAPDALRVEVAPGHDADNALVGLATALGATEALAESVAAWAPHTVGLAFGGAVLDAAGLREVKRYEHLRPEGMLPAPFDRLLSAVPGLVPHLVSHSVGPRGPAVRVYSVAARGLRLLDLLPLLEMCGLGGRAAAFLAGALDLAGGQFRLPPRSALVGLRPLQGGSAVEPKLEFFASTLGIPPAAALANADAVLLRATGSTAALHRWLAALAGADGAVALPVACSLRPGPGAAPLVSVYLSPSGWVG